MRIKHKTTKTTKKLMFAKLKTRKIVMIIKSNSFLNFQYNKVIVLRNLIAEKMKINYSKDSNSDKKNKKGRK